ncbi:MAG: DUF2796 domain-containing protein [Rubrivivax sp.]|nr:DUF2796 domain-containing protein [Rubrivivax sp.]
MLRLRLVTCVLALAAAGPALAGKAHEHGTARLDIAVAAGRVNIALDTPLDNLLGFERAPRTDAERQRADAAVALLRAADRMFRIDPAAGCTLAGVQLVSAALQLGATSATPGQGDHADLEGRFDFDCRHGARAGFVEVGLFEAFKGLSRIEVQVATPKGQMKATLRRPASRVALVR